MAGGQGVKDVPHLLRSIFGVAAIRSVKRRTRSISGHSPSRVIVANTYLSAKRIETHFKLFYIIVHNFTNFQLLVGITVTVMCFPIVVKKMGVAIVLTKHLQAVDAPGIHRFGTRILLPRTEVGRHPASPEIVQGGAKVAGKPARFGDIPIKTNENLHFIDFDRGLPIDIVFL